MRGHHSRRGGAGGTVMGLLALGFGSALVGALVVGPMLGKRLSAEPAPPKAAPAVEAALPSGGDRQAERPEREPRAELKTASARLSDKKATSEERHDEPDAGQTVQVDVSTGDPAEGASPTRDRDRASDDKREESRTGETRDGDATTTARPRTEPEEDSRSRSTREEKSAPREDEKPSRRGERARTEERREERRKEAASERAGKSDTSAKSSSQLPGESAGSEDSAVYRVRLGRFSSREEAEKFGGELARATGYTATPVAVGSGFRVQIGAYRHKVNAEKVAGALRDREYRPDVIETRKTADSSQ